MSTLSKLAVAAAMVGCLPLLAQAAGTLDPKAVTYQLPDQIKWNKNPNSGAESVYLVGGPGEAGLYIQLIKWAPGTGSRPHFHDKDRFITVLSGTWYQGTGTKYDPEAMVALPAGTHIVDHANGVHYDGAKDGTAIIQIVGQGPVSTTNAEVR